MWLLEWAGKGGNPRPKLFPRESYVSEGPVSVTQA